MSFSPDSNTVPIATVVCGYPIVPPANAVWARIIVNSIVPRATMTVTIELLDVAGNLITTSNPPAIDISSIAALTALIPGLQQAALAAASLTPA